MHTSKVAIILAFALSFTIAAPAVGSNEMEKRQSTLLNPFLKDRSEEGNDKRQSGSNGGGSHCC
ncbi:hypothetical protein LX32DRAFT_634013 [Colletotrichum zoysiae]|uniref:DUF4266 domain-containing protein n=1 Tax=Colletotrichum zoysiae TaxID=1216348 RepID=A0AAD9M7G6_9PEZI|nr:hypothetical protein LX32DRAFT_634013 [Colletotrichum zoysiae]